MIKVKKEPKIGVILGTRPEIIKLSPILRELDGQADYFILHTNQHYDKNLDKIFFKQLELILPKYNLRVGSGTHGSITGKMLIGIEQILIKENPDIVLVQGDTNTVLAGAIAASKLGIKIGHVEAGLRSWDKSMPEEINRIITDHLSSYLFAPTYNSRDNLLKENIRADKIYVTGNTVVDAISENSKISNLKSKIIKKLRIEPRGYFLVTAHRPENVDNRKKLENIFAGLWLIRKKFNLPMIFPIHPRTKKQINQFKINLKGINVIEPVGYLDFIQLIRNSLLVLTDSGGIQEEACILKKLCITLRENTERPETLKVGSNILAGTSPASILNKTSHMLKKKSRWTNPFGKIGVGKRIVRILKNT